MVTRCTDAPSESTMVSRIDLSSFGTWNRTISCPETPPLETTTPCGGSMLSQGKALSIHCGSVSHDHVSLSTAGGRLTVAEGRASLHKGQRLPDIILEEVTSEIRVTHWCEIISDLRNSRRHSISNAVQIMPRK